MISTDLEMQCKLYRRQYSETICFKKCTNSYTFKNKNFEDHGIGVNLKPL